MKKHANSIDVVVQEKNGSYSRVAQKKPGAKSIDAADAAVVKGMLARGDRQHDIAAWFGVNSGRIAEVKSGKTFNHVGLQTHCLPPSGPYEGIRDSFVHAQSMEKIQEELKALYKQLGYLTGRM